MLSILSVGQDSGLLHTRAAVLRQSKADVITAKFTQAMQTLRDQRFDLVVLCHTLSTEEMIEVRQASHALQNGVPVLQVVSDIRPFGQVDPVAADDVARSNPATLVDKVVEMLNLTDVSNRFRAPSSGLQDNS